MRGQTGIVEIMSSFLNAHAALRLHLTESRDLRFCHVKGTWLRWRCQVARRRSSSLSADVRSQLLSAASGRTAGTFVASRLLVHHWKGHHHLPPLASVGIKKNVRTDNDSPQIALRFHPHALSGSCSLVFADSSFSVKFNILGNPSSELGVDHLHLK